MTTERGQAPALVLASTSRYRRALLERLRLPFTCAAPAVDEQARPGEPPGTLALRLAEAKAGAVAARFPGAVVIGSDQVAVREGALLGKPGTRLRCVEQLRAASGRDVEFLTAVCVVGPEPGRRESHVDRTVVRFRPLADDEIERYVDLDEPLDCAGGFKAESLGIVLFEHIDSRDPTALTGLPLIWLSAALRRAGLHPLRGA